MRKLSSWKMTEATNSFDGEKIMEYRIATEKDIDTLCELRKKQLIDEGTTPDINIDEELHGFFQKKFKNDELVEWVLDDDGEIVATCAILFYEFPPSFTNKSGVKGYITNVYTKPELRGNGIATKMLGFLTEEAKKRGVKKLLLAASSMGRPVYKKFGFIEASEWLKLDNFN